MSNLFFVSPMTPNGVTFLLNIFLELRILIFRSDPDRGPADSWVREGRRYTMRQDEYNILRSWLPALSPGFFTFDSTPSVCWAHPVTPPRYPGFQNIVVARDPRDALYSWWRRLFTKQINFYDFLSAPYDRFKLYLPFLNDGFKRDDLIFKEYWAEAKRRINENQYGNVLDDHMASYEILLKSFFWTDSSGALPCNLLKFEDFKSSPNTTVLNLLAMLKIERDFSEISQAVLASSTDIAVKNDAAINGSPTVIRKGLNHEWLGNEAESVAYREIEKRLEQLFHILSYDIPQRSANL
jgi:hypothetical protein